jgi:DNA adenine methylase
MNKKKSILNLKLIFFLYKLIMDPIIQWVGGKKRLLNVLDLMLPNNYNTYYEPFLGGGALLYKLLPQNAKIYEININIYNLYINVKNNVLEIIENLLIYQKEYLDSPDRKNFYLDKRTIYNSLDYSTPQNSINKTTLLLFLNKTCFNAVYRENKKGEFNVPVGNMKNCTICNTEQLKNISNYLNNNNITIYNNDFTKFIDTIKPNDFVYLDPPYYPLKNDSFVGYDKNGFNKDKHDELINILHTLNTKKINFILSNSNNQYFRDKLRMYNIYDISIARTLNSNIDDRKDCVCEILVTNYNLNKTQTISISQLNYSNLQKNDNVSIKIKNKKYFLYSNDINLKEINKCFYNFIILNKIKITITNKYIENNEYKISLLFNN